VNEQNNIKMLTGNYAAAYAVKLSRVEVISAYPITPQTPIIEKLSEFVERGELNARFIRVESEHSAMASLIGAASVGARTYTATSAQGLLYMGEVVWWAAGARLPIVMGVVTRALAPPWSIWTDHTDILSFRDSGWIILFASNAQEVLDLTIQAFKIAENEKILLPVAVTWDAFVVSHTLEPVSIPEQRIIDEFLEKKRPQPHALNVDEPFSLGNITFPSDYMELRRSIDRAMKYAKEIIVSVDKEFGEKIGRKYGGLIEEYFINDADILIITLGVIGEEAKEAVDRLRKEDLRVGLIRLRSIRPFPSEILSKYCCDKKLCIVIERSVSFGGGGVILNDVLSTFYRYNVETPTIGYIAGLGGREVSVEDIVGMVSEAYSKLKDGKLPNEPLWYGVKIGERYE